MTSKTLRTITAGDQQHVSVRMAAGKTETAPLSVQHWSCIRKQWWKIAILAAIGSIAVYEFSRTILPKYESVATLEFDRENPLGVVGDQANRGAYSPDDDLYIATQMKMIQLDSILRPIAEGHHLLDSYKKSDSGSVELEGFKVSRPPNTRLLQIRYRSTDPVMAAVVANAVATSYLDQKYRHKVQSSATTARYVQQQLQELKVKMEESSKALAQYEKDLKVVNADQKTNLIAARLLQLNSEFTQAQSDRMKSEADVNLSKDRNLDAIQASSLSDPLQKLIERRNELRENFSQTKEHYGVEHPVYRRQVAQLNEIDRQIVAMQESISGRLDALARAAKDREALLAQSLNETKDEADALSEKTYDYERLKREAESDRQLYEQLVEKAKEAGINSSFRNETVRIVDPAYPAQVPVAPNVTLNVLLAFSFFLALGSGAAIAQEKMNTKVRNAAEVVSEIGIAVVGTLPKADRKRITKSNQLTPKLLAPKTNFILLDNRGTFTSFTEAVRALRNAIVFQPGMSRMRTVLVTSAVPREGKTTVAIHTALMSGFRRQKTLLIDADCCRPTVHRVLDLPNSTGLADFVHDKSDWRKNLIKFPTLPFLDVLTGGSPTTLTADLVGDRLGALLEEAASEYSLVVVDAPPVLACSETVPMAVSADGVLLVVEADSTERNAINTTLSMLKSAGAHVLGVALNKVTTEECSMGHYASYYNES